MKKLQRRKPAPPQPGTIPASSEPPANTARGPAPIALSPTSETSPDDEDVYTVSCIYTVSGVSIKSYVISLHSSRNQANQAARRYLDDKSPYQAHWDKYSKRFDPHDDGGICIAAENRGLQGFVVTVRKNNQECKPVIPQIPDPSLWSPSPQLRNIFLVTVEKRHYICEPNEDGALESLEVRGHSRLWRMRRILLRRNWEIS